MTRACEIARLLAARAGQLAAELLPKGHRVRPRAGPKRRRRSPPFGNALAKVQQQHDKPTALDEQPRGLSWPR
jgi:hypothetical protein